jgi:type I restriction enzyme M protein
MVFDQHILYHLDSKGIAVVVNNGSALFTGDAGGGESNIRKHFFDKDYVEAIIQLPSEEFFNTDIYTYLWIFNKNKPQEKKDKVALINASGLYRLLKKKKGKKRKRISSENIDQIVKALSGFKDDSITMIFDKWHFYYNKNIIRLKNVDVEGRSFESQLLKKQKSLK